jgi:GDPmannose 4,6-dehydratase
VVGIDRADFEALGNLPRLQPADILDAAGILRLVEALRPVDVYYLAAHHSSAEAEQEPPSPAALLDASYRVNVLGALHFLEALRACGGNRLFYASSSLVFGEGGRSELLHERSPRQLMGAYALTKEMAGQACADYRRRYEVFASVGILFNHESPLRGPTFLSSKVAAAVARIRAGNQERLTLGNLGAVVDWGHAPDFVDAFVRILALPAADDFVVATGEPHTVQELVSIAFAHVGLRWEDHVDVAEVILSRQGGGRIGDASKLRRATGWQPTLAFQQMVCGLVDAAARELTSRPGARDRECAPPPVDAKQPPASGGSAAKETACK